MAAVWPVSADGSTNGGSGGEAGAALVPEELIDDLGSSATAIHDYGAMWLVRFEGGFPTGVDRTIHALPATGRVGFRSWNGVVPNSLDPAAPSGGVFVVELMGPMDPRWREEIETAGLEILAPADPEALVVRIGDAGFAAAALITTSEGFPIIRGVVPLPLEARVHRSLLPALRGDVSSSAVELHLSGFGRRPLSEEIKAVLGADGTVTWETGELARRLDEHPEIGYVEPVFGIEPHNNLAARTGLVGVEPVWDLGYVGADVTVLHNDSGVDLVHADLAGVVRGAKGRMEYADTAHGTHTAGSIVGRGLTTAPTNTSGCGDLTPGLPSARGMAWGATLVTNNIFEEGFPEVGDMMAWGAGNGAQISSNSWGLIGQTGPEVGYSSAAVEADAAVRDADPQTPGAQPMSIFFSAGNTGPGAGTVTSPGTAKNVITIGAVENDRCGAWVPNHQSGPDPAVVLSGSGRGPSQGRLKPDLVAPGSDVLSLESGDPYAEQPWDEEWTGPELAINTGTSQACALSAGAGAVLHEFLWRNRGRRPSPALLKAALVVAADAGDGGADFARGWGRLDIEAAIEGPAGGSIFLVDQDETAELATGQMWSSLISVRSSSAPLEIGVVWTDSPGEEDADHPLVNDLDVDLTSPSGTVYRGNVFSGRWSVADPGAERDIDNNVEIIRVAEPESGTWIVEVVGVDVPMPPAGLQGQDFSLAVSGDAAPCAEAPPPPTGVEAVHLGDNRIRVDWTAVSGATRYEISRSDHPGGHPYVPIATVSAGAGGYIDEDVSGGSEYHYVVRADRSCWSEYSSEASATATGRCLLTPVFAGLASVDDPARSSCSLELSWAAAAPGCPSPVIYTVYRGDHPDFELSPDNRIVDSMVGTSRRDWPLESGRDHYYAVRAWHSGQEADDGNTVVIGGRPSGPDDVYFAEDAESVLDRWIREPGSPADSGTEPWTTTTDDAWTGEVSLFVADEDRVKDQVLMTAAPIVLPAGSEPILEFDHRFRLHKGRDGGRLEYSTNGGRDWQDILEGDGQTVPDDEQRWRSGGYLDTIGAPSNPLYRADGWTGDSRGWLHSVVDFSDFAGRRVLLRWRLGCDETPGGGWGWWLDDLRLVVEHDCLPCLVDGRPTEPTATATAGGVVLGWDDVPTATEYRIARSTRMEGPFQTLAEIAAPETGYRDDDASGGTTYSYVLSVGYDGCWSDESIGVTVTADGPCKLAPLFWGLDEVVDRRGAACALDLEWRPATPGCVGEEPSYRIYRSALPGFEPGPDSLLADDVKGARFRDTTVADSEVEHYRVRAVDGASGAEENNPVIGSGWTTGPGEIHFSDSVEDGTDGWWTDRGSSADPGTEPWGVVEDAAHTGYRSWFCRDEPRVKDQVVGLTEEFQIADATTVLAFAHLFDLEPFWDGGRLEVSTDGGSSWRDILDGDGSTVAPNPARFLAGGYTGFISPGTGNPLAGAAAWTGFDVGWTTTVVDLADFVGLGVRFRWRLGCDQSDARVGWWLDDVELRTTSRCETVESPPPRPVRGRRP